MTQPQWLTPEGTLGTIPEGVFYRVPLRATAGDQRVFFRLIAGQTPEGIQITENGFAEGIPRNIISLQGVPQEVARDVTSRFAVRAYTQRLVNGRLVIDRLADRTFELTVSGQDVPQWVTPAGNVGTFYDGTEVRIQLLFDDPDPDESVTVKIRSGSLPPGLTITNSGLISGVILPLIGPPGTAAPGEDATPWDEYPWDFTTRSSSKNYQFVAEITDGKESNLRTYEIFVYSKDSMSADTTDFTADNTFITADIVPTRTPLLLTPPGDLGRIRADNFYAFKFDAIDFDGDAIEYILTTGAGIGYDETFFDQTGLGFDRGAFSLPPGLTINQDTGWFYGYIPDQGATEFTYQFAVRVRKVNQPQIISDFVYFTITIIGDIDTEVIWLTPANLGTIDNGAVSLFTISAVNTGGRSLSYRLFSGSDSRLPQGLTLLPSGNIVGRVSFNTFALDGGTTTFDLDLNRRLGILLTTFDLEFRFTVNAFAPQTEQIGYRVNNIVIIDGGSGYTSAPTITIGQPDAVADAIQATAGVPTIVDGSITAIPVGNPGQGYLTPPVISITGGGGSGAAAIATIIEVSLINAVSVLREFTITVNRAYNEPYESLYIKAMPPQQDRDLITNLIQNQDIIPESLLFRRDDPNFGVAKNVVYEHAYGLTASTVDRYIESLQLNHYWKNITLGAIKTARALNSQGQVIYEVVYSEIIDDLVNNQGQSVDKEVTLPYPVIQNGRVITEVYPNSLTNMRDQVIDTVGQISPQLPLWMTSKQTDGRVLGFTPAWIIAYVKPGEGDRVAYNIRTRFAQDLNTVDYKIDRYELNRSQTRNWDAVADVWIPSPPQATTFDTMSMPRNLVSLGNVDYATTLPFVDIQYRPMDYIAERGGIDGVFGRQLDDRLLVFQQQEGFSDLTPEEAFTDFTPPYDADGDLGAYDAALYSQALIIPIPLRLAIYRINVDASNVVSLTLETTVTTNNSIRITRGVRFNNTDLYLPNSAPAGLVLPTWSLIPEQATTPTIFDGGATTFISPADRWTASDEFDKYLVFPKTNILG